MNLRLGAFLVLLGVAVGCGRKPSPPAALPTAADRAKDNPIAAPVNYLGAVGAAKKMAEKTIDSTTLNQAIQRFRAMEDRNPESLDELVRTHYLQALPKPPYGMKFVYDAQSGQARVVRAQ